ncbi:hypothetical protein ALC57_06275 [Trachymyrmex cornetzi]|uniref:Uncharacterized protein n=1 Tax=Trachymyrmex cornetzi TaxID=471704 RepID=A0A195E810_9HYME|nr:hypothetical protein ALC57_06275 [Trachymyrmex cornetzi]
MTSRTAKPKWRTRSTTNDSDDNDGYKNENDECEARREREAASMIPLGRRAREVTLRERRKPAGNKPGRIEKDLWSRKGGSGRATEVLRGNERVWDGKGGQTATAWMDGWREGGREGEEGRGGREEG